MGQKLIAYYEKAKVMGGAKASIRLAVITKIPSSVAVTQPDSPANIALFENAMKEISKEFKS